MGDNPMLPLTQDDVLEMLEANNCDGLRADHIRDAAKWEQHDDGSVTFEVERHPHVFGRRTRGRRSGLFAKQIVVYRASRTSGISVESSEVVDFQVDEQALSSEVEESISDGGFIPEGETEDEARKWAEKFAAETHWIPDSDYKVPDDIKKRCREVCIRSAIEVLMTEWREMHC